LEDFDGVFFYGFCFREALVIVEVDKIGGSVILASLSAFRAVPGEVSYLSALEAGIGRVSGGGCIALVVILGAVSLVSVGILSPSEVVTSVVSSIVPASWSSVSIDVHGDRGIVHPAGSVG